MEEMILSMRLSGFPIDESRKVVCIGHSMGGQLCRHYASKLTSIKGIILLDSVPTGNWYMLVG
jgi:pimeloyl-ACP methyl ester carboxylesterase